MPCGLLKLIAEKRIHKSLVKNDACSTLIKLDKEYPNNKLKSKVAKKVSELNCSVPSE